MYAWWLYLLFLILRSHGGTRRDDVFYLFFLILRSHGGTRRDDVFYLFFLILRSHGGTRRDDVLPILLFLVFWLETVYRFPPFLKSRGGWSAVKLFIPSSWVSIWQKTCLLLLNFQQNLAFNANSAISITHHLIFNSLQAISFFNFRVNSKKQCLP